jgi:CheY-like chemotaxis protein
MPATADSLPISTAPSFAAAMARPLSGLTVLLVEDSRFASEAMRLLCLNAGARIRRADCIHAARRHLCVYRPHVVIVDLGLPDGMGEDLIADLHRATPRIDVILATSGNDDAEDRAIAAGADGFLAKPLTNLAQFQQAILRHLPDMHTGPQLVTGQTVIPDVFALNEDIRAVCDDLRAGRSDRAYLRQFLTGLSRLSPDSPASEAAEMIRDGAPTAAILDVLTPHLANARPV